MSDLISRISLIEDARERRKDVLWDRYTEADDKPFDDLIKLCKRAERYRWHDLRKNPEDLPKDVGNSYVVCYKLWNELHYGIFGYRTSFDFKGVHFCSYDSEYGDAVIDDVIAWRRIEPFMEGEE